MIGLLRALILTKLASLYCLYCSDINNLLSSGNISYSLIKKCIHRMENGEKESLGGDTFYNWLKQTLNSDRNSLELSKNAKSESGVSNAHNQTHTKDNLNIMNRLQMGWSYKCLNRPKNEYLIGTYKYQI